MEVLNYSVSPSIVFLVYDAPPSGDIVMEIRSIESLDDYAKFIRKTRQGAVKHAYDKGWLDFQTMTEWLNIIGTEETKVQVATANMLQSNVTNIALIFFLGLIAYNLLTKEK